MLDNMNKKMKIVVIGNGKLATSLLKGLSAEYSAISWNESKKSENEKVILLHAGSGRELSNCIEYCEKSKSIMIDLATGIDVYKKSVGFPIIICPNAAVPILLILKILNHYGSFFSKYHIELIESHQSQKKSIAGTAMEIAKEFNLPEENIKVIRDKCIQKNYINIPDEYLDLHAYHRIIIKGMGAEINIETKVFGHDAYIEGIKVIINRIEKEKLENKKYHIIELLGL